MSSDLIQHAIVTLIALAAGGVLVSRLVGFVGRRSSGAPACASCAASKGSGTSGTGTRACASGTNQAGPAPLNQPVTLIQLTARPAPPRS